MKKIFALLAVASLAACDSHTLQTTKDADGNLFPVSCEQIETTMHECHITYEKHLRAKNDGTEESILKEIEEEDRQSESTLHRITLEQIKNEGMQSTDNTCEYNTSPNGLASKKQSLINTMMLSVKEVESEGSHDMDGCVAAIEKLKQE
jgi:hypothetical protein